MFSFKLNRPGRGDEADAASDEVSDTASAAESAANEGPEAAEPKAAEPEVAGPDANLAARGETAWDPTRGDEESAKMTPSVDDARKQQDNAGNPEGPEKGLISEETQKAASASLSALLAATRKPEAPAVRSATKSWKPPS